MSASLGMIVQADSVVRDQDRRAGAGDRLIDDELADETSPVERVLDVFGLHVSLRWSVR